MNGFSNNFYRETIEIYTVDNTIEWYGSFVESGISAGFPSPADDFLDMAIDLNKELIKNPGATFYGRVRGNSMVNAGLSDVNLPSLASRE